MRVLKKILKNKQIELFWQQFGDLKMLCTVLYFPKHALFAEFCKSVCALFRPRK